MFHLHGGIQFEYETASLDDQLSQYVRGRQRERRLRESFAPGKIVTGQERRHPRCLTTNALRLSEYDQHAIDGVPSTDRRDRGQEVNSPVEIRPARDCKRSVRRFYHLVIDIEPYYGLHPIWLRVIQRPLEDAARKKFLNETVIYETYKKYFGRKKATSYKVLTRSAPSFVSYVRFLLCRLRSTVYVLRRNEDLPASSKR